MARSWSLLRKYGLIVIGLIVAVFGSIQGALAYLLSLFSLHGPPITLGVAIPLLGLIAGCVLIGLDIYFYHRPAAPSDVKSTRPPNLDQARFDTNRRRELRISWPYTFDLLDDLPKDFYTDSEYKTWFRTMQRTIYFESLSRSTFNERFRVSIVQDIRKYAYGEIRSRRRYRLSWWARIDELFFG